MLSASLEPLPGAQMVLLLPLRTPTASCSSTPQRTATSSAAGEGSVPPRDLDQLGLSKCVHHNLCDALSPRQAVPGVGVSLPPNNRPYCASHLLRIPLCLPKAWLHHGPSYTRAVFSGSHLSFPTFPQKHTACQLSATKPTLLSLGTRPWWSAGWQVWTPSRGPLAWM